jgi:hypothetical protein
MYSNPVKSYITVGQNYCEAGMDFFEMGATANSVVEYNAGWGAQGNANNHGNAIQLFWSEYGSITRYNILRDNYNGGYPGSLVSGGSAPISISMASETSGETLVYGNIIDGDDSNGIEACPPGSAWGSGGFGKNVHVYNNTIIHRAGDTGGTSISLDWQNTSGNQIYNNLVVAVEGTGLYIHGDADTRNNVLTTDTSMFVDYAKRDYRLAKPLGAGTAYGAPFGVVLPAPYNTDLTRKVRGADGSWDIGAYEY